MSQEYQDPSYHSSDAPPPRPPQPRRPQRRPRRSGLLGPILIVCVILFLFVGFTAVIGFAFLFRQPSTVSVSNDSVLVISFKGPITEYAPPNPFEDLFGERKLHLHDYVYLIRKAQTDANIKGILLQLEMTNTLGFSQVEDLRDAIQDFRAAGKWVIAQGEMWTEREYFLASAADEVYMPAEAMCLLDGFYTETNFYGDFLEKYGVGVTVTAIGEYKSFADQYRRNTMSDPAREASEALLATWEGAFLDAAAGFTGMSVEDVKAQLDRGLMRADVAKDAGFLTDLLYRDQVDALIAERLGVEELSSGNRVPANRYWRAGDSYYSGRDGSIAVIYGSGAIQSGVAVPGLFGGSVIASDSFVRQLRAARKSKNVKAVVLRIDSPGGSALASDVIWREVRLLSEAGKPVIASMGNVAASGGYYIAMACDEIVARPTTVTGSIGVVLMRWNFEGLLGKHAINNDVVKTSPNADFFNFNRNLSEAEVAQLETRTRAAYTSFVAKAAESRGVTYEQLDPVAQGRVWSGADAHQRGLVDHLGGLQKALEVAAERAGLSSYRTINYPIREDNWDMLKSYGLAQTETVEALRSLVPKELRFLYDAAGGRNDGQILAIAPYHLPDGGSL